MVAHQQRRRPCAGSRGPTRPVRGEAERAYVVAAFEMVDCVVRVRAGHAARARSSVCGRTSWSRAATTREDTIVGATQVRGWGGDVRHSAHPRSVDDQHHPRSFVATTELTPPASAARSDALRPITLERGAAPNAEGSCLVSFGSTRVLCTASVEDGVPGWRRGKRRGVDHRGVCDASARDVHAYVARARSDRRSDAGDPATDRSKHARDAR